MDTLTARPTEENNMNASFGDEWWCFYPTVPTVPEAVRALVVTPDLPCVSRSPIAALGYANTAWVARFVTVDPSPSQPLHFLWAADATRALYDFGVWCAQRVLDEKREIGLPISVFSWEYITVGHSFIARDAKDVDLDLFSYGCNFPLTSFLEATTILTEMWAFHRGVWHSDSEAVRRELKTEFNAELERRLSGLTERII